MSNRSPASTPTNLPSRSAARVINLPANPADDAIIASTYIAGQRLVSRGAADPGCTQCELKIQYAAYQDTEPKAVVYGPQPSADNMIIIDRSGSMGWKLTRQKAQPNFM